MNTIELARQAKLVGDSSNYDLAEELKYLETFTRLVIEDFVKGVGMEPAITKTEKGIILHLGFDDIKAGEKFYTATKMAAQRHKALEEAAEVADNADCLQNSTFEGVAAAIRALKEKA